MNKADLVQNISEAAELKVKEAEGLLDAMVTAIGGTLAKGDKVALTGFGTFSVTKRKARKGRNPRTKKEITIPASKAPRFTAGKGLKDSLKSGKKK
jgi:DNA-binding protein HU-beta